SRRVRGGNIPRPPDHPGATPHPLFSSSPIAAAATVAESAIFQRIQARSRTRLSCRAPVCPTTLHPEERSPDSSPPSNGLPSPQHPSSPTAAHRPPPTPHHPTGNFLPRRGGFGRHDANATTLCPRCPQAVRGAP